MKSTLPVEGQMNPAERLLTIGDLFAFWERRKATVLAAVAFFLLLGLLLSIFSTRRYESEALLEVREPEDTLGLTSIGQNASRAAQVVNPLEETVTLATKVNELTSNGLDLEVIERLHLEGTQDFKHTFNPIGWISGFFSSKSKADAPGTTLANSPTRRAWALSIFQKQLQVAVVPGTRLISIKYSSSNAETAAQVANELAEGLAQYGYEIKFRTTSRLTSWLNDQLDRVRQNMANMQEREIALRRETRSYTVGTNASGQENLYNPILDQLQQSTAALNQAESNRILREAVEQIVRTRNPQLISGLAGSGMLGSGDPQSTTSLELINNLELQIAQQQSVVDRDQVVLGDSFPRLTQERATLQALTASLQKEINRLSQRAENDSKIAKEQLQRTRAEHDQLITQAQSLNDKYLQYQVVQQEAQDARELYTDLVRRLNQVSVVNGMEASDTSLFAPAQAADKPSSPHVLRLLLASVVLGALIGVLVALVLESRDKTITSPASLSAEADLPVVGVLPAIDAQRLPLDAGTVPEDPAPKSELLTRSASLYSDAIRSLRAKLSLSSPGASRIVLVTSSQAREGKSTIALNIAVAAARAGAKTLLVDANLRNPSLAASIRATGSGEGFNRMLRGELEASWHLPFAGVPNLSFVPAGVPSEDMHDLIGSHALTPILAHWRELYETVILDAGPLLSVADSLTLAHVSDLVLFVVRYGVTTVPSLTRAAELLAGPPPTKAAIVFNALPAKSLAFRNYFNTDSSTRSRWWRPGLWEVPRS